MRSLLSGAAAVVVLATAGCRDFATPAELEKPTVLAVVATPPITRPGQSSTLEVLMADVPGPTTPDAVYWELTPTYPGYGTIGTISPGLGGQATYNAPSTLPTLPEGALPIDTLSLRVTKGSLVINTLKLVGIADLESANPTIELRLDGSPVPEPLVVQAGAALSLDVAPTPAPAPDGNESYAWYSTVGTIEGYQGNPVVLEIPEDAAGASGWLHAVYRDGVGGAAVKSIALTVAP